MSRVRIIANKPGPFSVPPEVMTLAAPQVDTDAAGWDVMRETLWVPYSPYFAAGERREHALHPDLATTAVMVVQTERVVASKAGMPVVELTSWGIARAKPWKCTTSQDSQGQVGTSTGVTRNLPTITCYWFSSTLEGTKLYVPWPAVPPETFGWSAQGVTNTASPFNNWGWCIIRRDVEPLPVITGNNSAPGPWKNSTIAGGESRTDISTGLRPGLCAVTDYYVYDIINPLPPND